MIRRLMILTLILSFFLYLIINLYFTFNFISVTSVTSVTSFTSVTSVTSVTSFTY